MPSKRKPPRSPTKAPTPRGQSQAPKPTRSNSNEKNDWMDLPGVGEVQLVG
ncbi:unnamed protein product [Penicillium camemberti]|uniref:Str. FM013 n=1 Tax=Penicillium camemberti (strain FM 013) TaxID=1429867 RepID=A0A0G4PQA9_PENC3|nr:unnamed protein product [Penicillium camemberti]